MERNNLYPIFLKVKQLKVLIVGGGYVAEEKLTFLLKSSPDACVTMVSPMFREGTVSLAKQGNVKLVKTKYKKRFLKGRHIVVATTDKPKVNEKIYKHCRKQSVLVNVADNPPLCDFYMGGIVTKGNVKVAISTNGKSPTMAKRLRQFFEEVIPENIDDLVKNLNEYRKTIKGDFEEKVEKLNEFTKGIIENKESEK
ncbi:bifunctional precorrin-2 dehydrogenase/sirohydrochlorin ferrochelatase [Seonamhaeicola sp. MEBiC1930]|uniref:precorrin-2 dehydrogenase/sirohydrochlorin ferrochelatase family protein n=1 Tax=Seonamhaeicola sp. MEBiC01930 TaxID=2976768 RepID=UPI00324CC907